MVSNARFFDKKPLIKKVQEEKSFINVGGDPFHALAVAFVDNVKRGIPLSEESVTQILKRFSLHFPEYQLKQSYLSAPERLRLLVNGPRKLELITSLSYVLRQITVDQLLSNPLQYKEVLASFHNDLSQDYLRQQTTVLPANALAALTDALDVSLELAFKTRDKSLPNRHCYHPNHQDVRPFKLVLQVEEPNLYFPQVQRSDFFISLTQVDMSMKVIHPKETPSDSTLKEVQECIQMDNQRIWALYERYRTMLMALVADGELTRDQLLDLYITHLPKATDNGLFLRLEQEHSTRRESVVVTSEQALASMLIDALAQGFCTQEINEEILDKPTDSLEHRVLSA